MVLYLLEDARERRGATLLVVTYDPLIGERADRVLHLRDGRLVDEPQRPDLRTHGGPAPDADLSA
jgi:predicted ABC-type transport system involved in lysophospholipase L1 biosynthesis ATPase subunit